MEIKLIEQTAQPTIFVRVRTSVDKLTEVFDANFTTLMDYMSKMGTQPVSGPYAAYYNHDMQDLDVEIGFPVASILPEEGEIKTGEISASEKTVQGIHKGSYSTLNQTYEHIYQYIAEHKLEQTGPHYDFYINNPDDTQEDELLTKIVIAVK